MRRLPKVFVVVGLSLIAALGVGCKQGVGERCEQDSDCADGLTCSRMEVSAEAGRCEGNTGTPDTGVPQDVDAGTDASDDAPMSMDADASDDAPTSMDADTTDTPMSTDADTTDASPTSDAASAD